jgi:hypothetical protein
MMPMLSREFGVRKHSIMLRTMLSFEPVTVTKRRFPQLFQTGETAIDLPIIDGQHPHNFFMELAGRYDVNIGKTIPAFLLWRSHRRAGTGPIAFPIAHLPPRIRWRCWGITNRTRRTFPY